MVLKACAQYRTRVPLILLEGDVGTGKTALAETVGDAIARQIGAGAHVHLLKINTQVRGTGQVGEMSDLIVQAFHFVLRRAQQRPEEPVLLLLDEADALAASREVQQMHHEDKAGLDTLLQQLDSLRHSQLPIAAMFITNRPDALDPAVRRRAALDLHFQRPADTVRGQLIYSALPELQLDAAVVKKLVALTGADEPKNGKIAFTASDITDRLIPAAIRKAYQNKRALQATDLVEQAREMQPSPGWGGEEA
jgi:AAA+ superfamily predicted ATPase